MKLKKATRIALLSAAIVATSVLALLLLLQTAPVRSRVLKTATDYLRSESGLQLEANRFEYNLFQGSIRSGPWTLRSATPAAVQYEIRADSLQLQLKLFPLLRRSLRISRAEIHGLSVNIVRDTSIAATTPAAAPESGKEGPSTAPDLVISSLQVPKAALYYQDRSTQLIVNVPQWQLEVLGEEASPSHLLKWSIGTGAEIRLGERVLPVQSALLEAFWKQETLEIRRLELESLAGRLQASGRISRIADPIFDLRFDSSPNLLQILKLAGTAADVQGDLSITASLVGSLSDLSVSGRARSDRIRVAGIPDLRLNAEAGWQIRDGVLVVRSISAESARGVVHGTARIDIGNRSGVPSGFEAELTGLDLLALSKDWELPVRIAARLRAKARAHWPGLQWDQAVGQAEAVLEPTRKQADRGIVPLASKLNVQLQGKTVAFEWNSTRVFGADMEGRLTLRANQEIEGHISARAESVKDFQAQLQGYLGKQKDFAAAALQLDGTVSATATLSGSLQQPQITATFSGSGIAAGPIRDIGLQGEALFESQRLQIPRAQLRWQGQQLDLHGDIDFSAKAPVVKATAAVDSADLKALLAELYPELTATGRLQAQVDIAGTPDRIGGRLKLQGNGLSVYGENLGDLTANVELADKRLNLSRFYMQQSSGTTAAGILQATGEYYLDSGRYALQAAGEGLRLQNVRLAEDLPIQARFNLDVHAAGTLSQPAGNLRLEATEVALGKQELGAVSILAGVEKEKLVAETNIPGLNLTGSIKSRLQSPYPSEILLHAQNTDLSRWPLLQQVQDRIIQGRLTGDLSAQGDLIDWRSGRASVRVSHLRLLTGGAEIRNEGLLELRLDHDELVIPPARLAVADALLRLEGRFPFTTAAASGTIAMDGEGDLSSLQHLVSLPEGLQAAGKVAVQLKISGNLQKPQAAGQLTLRGGRLAGPAFRKAFEGWEADATLADGTLRLNRARGAWGGAEIEARAQLPLGLLPWEALKALDLASGSATCSIEIRNLPMDTVVELPPEVSGQIGLRLHGEADRLDLDSLKAQAEANLFRLKFGELVVEQAQPATASLENGVVRLEAVALKGDRTFLELRGSAALTGSRALDLTAGGSFDAALLAFWLSGMKASGDTRFHLALNGNLDAPEMSGFVETAQGRLSMPALGMLADSVGLRIGLKGDRIEIEKFAGTLNGGSLQAQGSARLRSGQLQDVRLDGSAGNLFLNIPRGLKTRASADIHIRSQQENIVLGGQVRILEGAYRDRLDLEGNLLSQLGGSQVSEAFEPKNEILSKILYDLGLTTEGPVVIDNNLAKLSLDADLRVGGGYYRPIITGRISIAEGGQVVFNERSYSLEKGVIDFLNQTETEPSFDIIAKTQVAGDEIGVQVGGTLDAPTTQLTSEKGYSEPDIVSMLLTGRTMEQLRGSELNVAKEQLLSQLTGRVGSSLTEGAGTALGLSELRIEPNLIAPESEPGARLTVGKDITGNLKLVYSMNLVDGGDQIWLAEFDYRRMFNSRAIKQADNTFRYEFRHDLAFGGKAKSSPAAGRASGEKKKVGRIDFFGEGPISKEKLASSFKIRSGDRFDFFKLQDGLQRLGDLYAEQGLLGAQIRAERETNGDRLDLSVKIVPGPKIDFAFDGWEPPSNVKERIQEIWRDGIVDAQRTEAAVSEIRRSLADQGFLDPRIDSRDEAMTGVQRRITFAVRPGTRYSTPSLVFEGAQQIPAELLQEQIASARLSAAIVNDPDRVADHLTRYYRRLGFLDARVSSPRMSLDPVAGKATTLITVSEGARLQIGNLLFRGNRALSEFQLQPAAGLNAGDDLDSGRLDSAIERIEKLYWLQGFNDVEIRYSLERKPGDPVTAVLFNIQEKKQAIVAAIRLEGADRSSAAFARNRLALTEGEVLSYDKLIRARRNLYDSGAFALVDITTEDSTTAGASLESDQRAVAVKVQLRETRPLTLHYGGFYDTDRGPGGIVDAAVNNFFGGPRILGLQGRYDRQLREMRGFYSQPTLAGRPLKTNATTFMRREVNDTFITDRVGFSLQQEVSWRKGLLLSYGYRYERAHTFDKVPDPVFPFDITLPIARLTGAVSRDTRDDLLDASRGSFLSQALEFGPSRLGSDLRFVKYYGQYFKYLPLSSPAPIAGAPGLRRPRWIYATGLRVGMAKGLGGQMLIPSERYFAGGGTTIRGFEQDQAGPKDFFGSPEGGDALFLFNNEIRFPIFSIFDGVGFLDVGNVYSRISDFDPLSVRKAAGMGLRIRTPYFLLRVDYGFKLDRQPGESLGRFFFSIGQAY